MVSLYSITADTRQRLDDVLEIEDISDDALRDILDEIKSDAKEKHLSVAAYILDLESQIKQMDEYIENMKVRRNKVETKAERLTNSLLVSMQLLGVEKYKSLEFDISIKESRGRAVPIDASLTPENFKRKIITEEEPDKSKINDALRNNEIVPGWVLVKEKSLKIKSH
jgi:Siphovirus Gp157